MSNPPIPAVRVATMEAVNYTPVMLGNAAGLVITPSPKGCITIATPSKALIGKSRWLLRALIQDLGLAGYQEAEYWPGIQISLKNGKETLKLGLVQLIYGTTATKQQRTVTARPWKALYTVRARPSSLIVRPDRHYTKEPTTTRYSLATMGLDDRSKDLKVPIEPGSLRLKVEILRRPLPRSLHMPMDTEAIEALDYLVAGLTIVTLRILGIGQGSNRGFGRFKITRCKIYSKLENEICEIIGKLDNVSISESDAENYIKQAIDKLQYLIQKVTGKKGKNTVLIDRECIKVYKLDYNTINCLNEMYSKLPGFKGQSMPKDPIHRSLEVIGLATLKVTWKNINKKGRAGGGAYHTWILGLPRRQNQSKVERCLNNGKKPPTGYLLKASSDDDATVILEKRKDLYVAVDSGSNAEKYINGRRQSPVIMFPVNDRGEMIAVIPFKPIGMEELVDKLYHAGGLAHTIKKGRKTILKFLDAVRLAEVGVIAKQGYRKVTHNCHGDRYANNKVRGVARPHSGTRCSRNDSDNLSENNNLVDEAYDAALAFINEILTYRNCSENSYRQGQERKSSRVYGSGKLRKYGFYGL
ncbi:MAG: hypothetical protein GSR84_02015 [Desulfurococcales archaeon]|nr:hypothetical protein [Desulfurococcales archaeon]